ncbi:MAG: hypothetical protein WAQ24_03000 [Candidatus Saccharimonadales bacterium]
MNTLEAPFPYGDISYDVLNSLAVPGRVSDETKDRLRQTPNAQARLEVYGLLNTIGGQIATNPLSPSNAFRGNIAPPANKLTVPGAHHLGLDLYHAALLQQDPSAYIQEPDTFSVRLEQLKSQNLTRVSQILAGVMRWSQVKQPNYYGIVEATSRERSSNLMAAMFLGAYVGVYIERGAEDIDHQLYARVKLPFMRRQSRSNARTGSL